VALSSAISAATSEVEDYRRVETSMVPDCTINGAAAGDVVHLLAELIDNALRYSPPASPVRVSASQRSDAAVVIEVLDVGLGMTDGDRRIANMRLRAGGEVTPDSARHMGLFVVGRLADRHGIRVRLRGLSTEQARSGTTAEVYLPATLLAGVGDFHVAPREPALVRTDGSEAADHPPTPDHGETPDLAALAETPERNGSHSTDRRSACCHSAGPDPAASPVPRPSGRHGVKYRCAGGRRRPSRLLKSRKLLRLNQFRTRRHSSDRGCGLPAGRPIKPSRLRRSR
jgi:anti-sigma regulatory factor (Ser/Thr protein kinase)